MGGGVAAGLGVTPTFGYLIPRCWVDGVDLITCQHRRGRAHDVVHVVDVVVGGGVVRVADEGLRIGFQLVANVAVEAIV